MWLTIVLLTACVAQDNIADGEAGQREGREWSRRATEQGYKTLRNTAVASLKTPTAEWRGRECQVFRFIAVHFTELVVYIVLIFLYEGCR